MRRQRTSRCRGFTLIETMATVVVLSTLGSIATFIVVDAVDDYQQAAMVAQLHSELATALDRAARELRKVPLSGTVGGIWPDFSFFVQDLQILWTGEAGALMGIYISGSKLRLQIAAGQVYTLIDDVDSIGLSVFGEDDNGLGALLTLANAGTIRRIELTINVTRDAVSQSRRIS